MKLLFPPFVVRMLLLYFCLCVYSPTYSQVVLNTALSEGSTEEEILVHMLVKEAPMMLSMQYVMVWNTDIWVYQGAELKIASRSPNVFTNPEQAQSDGTLVFSWIAEDISNGQSLSEGDTVFTLKFNRLSFEPHNIAFFEFSSSFVSFELLSSEGELLNLASDNTDIFTAGTRLQGQVFIDQNEDCIFQEEEILLANETILFTDSAFVYTVTTDDAGFYQTDLPPGKYTVLEPPILTGILAHCNPTDTFITTTESVRSQPINNIGFRAQSNCPAMYVSIFTNRLRRCFDTNVYTITYGNLGIVSAENAFIEVHFDEFLEVQSSSLPGLPLENNKYLFELGTVPSFEEGKITIRVKVNCENTTLGQTHCVEAFISPDTTCVATAAEWSRANLVVEKNCTEEGIVFMLHKQSFVLPANGATYRFETQQVPHHPIPTPLFASIEGCGRNESGGFSLEHITNFSLAETNPFYSIHCEPNRGSFDPNDKRGFPVGYGPLEYIEQDQSLNYHIRFQNTGT